MAGDLINVQEIRQRIAKLKLRVEALGGFL